MSTPSAPRLLYVDDERLLHSVFERLFPRHGFEVTCCASAVEATERLKRERFDLIITDFKMPEMDGLELLAHVRQEHPDTPVIMITAHASVQHAVGAMRGGAVDYIAKPFSTQVLLERVQAHLATPPEGGAPAAEAPARRRSGKAEPKPAVLVGGHPSVEQLRALIARIAPSQASVFVHGESGTGKEVVARLLHAESDRAAGPFVAINCANLPRDLVESHLFGHRKGAFTGAIEDMTGAFEQADGGTLLLDEITEVDGAVQAKLLRVLQEQEIHKVGASEPRRVNVRVVATSNRDLQEAIRQGVFREDLYHRLAVFPFYVPPLRERLSDVPALAAFFVEKYCTIYGLPPKVLAPALLDRFARYPWPGNIRQLENMVHRGVVLAGVAGVIEADDVMNAAFADGRPAEGPAAPANVVPLHRRVTIEEMEREMILRTLTETNQNQEAAAERLGICARTIRNKLRKYREEGYAA